MSSSKIVISSLALFAVSGAAACNGIIGPSESSLTGTATAFIKSVPAGVGCVRVVADGNGITSQTERNVAAGQSYTLSLSGLPTGSVVFRGEAYNASCAAVDGGRGGDMAVTGSFSSDGGVFLPGSSDGGTTAGVPPSYIAAPTLATLTPGVTAAVHLIFRPLGSADVGIEFGDVGGATDLGVPFDLSSSRD